MQKFIWVIPFIAFLGGYLACTFFISPGTMKAPSIVGLMIQEAAHCLSSNNINFRVLQEKEIADLPAGTILSQTPAAGNPIKPYQSMFVVLSKRPSQQCVPLIVKKSITEIQELLKEKTIRAQFYMINHHYPKGLCIGTWPCAGRDIDEKMIVYVSDGLNKPVIIPSFQGMPVKHVTDFLNEHHIRWQAIHHKDNLHSIDHCIVTHQRPLAGSIITLNDACIIDLYCS